MRKAASSAVARACATLPHVKPLLLGSGNQYARGLVFVSRHTRSPRLVGGCYVRRELTPLRLLLSCFCRYVDVVMPINARYRNLHRVSMEEHNTLLKGRGWTEEEFEAGFRQGVAPRQGSEHFIQYEALVRRELAKGEVRKTERPTNCVMWRKTTFLVDAF